MTDEQMTLALRSSLTDLVAAYDRECESRAYASLFERLGIPFTVAAAAGFLLWPAMAVVAGPAGVAAAILSSGGAAAYGLWAFSTESRALSRSKTWAKALSEADQKVLAPQTAKLTQAVRSVQGKLLELEAKKESPQVGAATPAGTSPSKPSTSTGENTSETSEASGSNPFKANSSSDRKCPIASGSLAWKNGEHFALIGLSGSSKTSTLLQCVPADELVVYGTLKADDKAPQSWYAFRLNKFADDAFLKQLDGFCDMIESLVRLAEQGYHHRLLIDEALTLIQQAKEAVKATQEKTLKGVADRFEGLVKLYIRTGRSDGHYLGLVTQSPNGTDLFDSAKTLQGLKTVLCAGEASSNRFDYLLSWAKQLYGQWLNAEVESYLASIQEGFWHFWMDGGQLHGARTQKCDRPLVKIEPFTPALGVAAIKAIRQAAQGRPAAAATTDEEVDWEGRAMELCSVPPGTGLKVAFAMVLGVDRKVVQGTRWQQLRDGLRAAMPSFPTQLQQELEARFPNVVLKPGQPDED